MPEHRQTTMHDAAQHHQISDIVRDILQDIGRIIRGEIRLASTELTENARKAGGAAAVLGGAAVAGLFAGASLVTACIAALAIVLPLWLAALIMGGLLGLIAGAAYAAGRAKLADVNVVPERAVQTLKESAQWAKQQTE